MSKLLTNQDYCNAAHRLKCEVAKIKAVAAVESARSGFLGDGRVKILFERHHFRRFTNGAYDISHPQISSRNPGGYAGNEAEYARFSQAYQLNPKAAMMSASWGRFQIMGFNYGVCGFTSINDFVDAMKVSEGEQLQAFCGFVEHNHLNDELVRGDWAGFARGYNGGNYRINQYDVKMKNFYDQFKLEKIDCGQYELTPENVGHFIDSTRAGAVQGSASFTISNPPPDDAIDKQEAIEQTGAGPESSGPQSEKSDLTKQDICKERPSTFTRWMSAIKTFFGGAITLIGGYLGIDDIKAAIVANQDKLLNGEVLILIGLLIFKLAIVVGVGLGVMWLAAWFYDNSANRANQLNRQKLDIASRPELITTELNTNKTIN